MFFFSKVMRLFSSVFLHTHVILFIDFFTYGRLFLFIKEDTTCDLIGQKHMFFIVPVNGCRTLDLGRRFMPYVRLSDF